MSIADAGPVLEVDGLTVEFPAGRKQVVHAVSDVSFELRRGETMGIVGESGCGKTTTGRALMQLVEPTAGSVQLLGRDLTELSGVQLREARRRMQMIFQDPVAALNPRRKVKELVREGLDIWGDPAGDFTSGRVDEILRAVGLDPEVVNDRRPHEFSGGQCQRIAIARALVLDPDVLICDEAVSALDVSVQAQILNLLRDLRERYELTMLFISHDLAVVRHVSDRVMVMYLGKVAELSPTDGLFATPRHPYTRALLASIPGHALDLPPADELISGELPSPIDPPSGCRFRTRCPRATQRCADEEPELRAVGVSLVACHHPHDD
ncbi:MAG: oligopeptide/dipeptide ABC transporter ATP-binding protein [Actinomycetota bacterium]